MNMSKHSQKRMSQRGIKKALIELAVSYGRLDCDKYVLDRQTIDGELMRLDEERRVFLQARDKGGVTVVEDRNRIITTYNVRKHRNS